MSSPAAPGGILTLDLSTRTGWAYGLPGQRPYSGVWILPGVASHGDLGAALVDRLSDTLVAMKPRLCVFEAPLPPAAHIKRDPREVRALFGLAFVTEIVCQWHDVEPREESVATARLAMLGRGNFPRGQAKPAVLAWVRSLGFEPRDDNQADALLLWHHACAGPRRR